MRAAVHLCNRRSWPLTREGKVHPQGQLGKMVCDKTPMFLHLPSIYRPRGRKAGGVRPSSQANSNVACFWEMDECKKLSVSLTLMLGTFPRNRPTNTSQWWGANEHRRLTEEELGMGSTLVRRCPTSLPTRDMQSTWQ